jgi:hypothetical protein
MSWSDVWSAECVECVRYVSAVRICGVWMCRCVCQMCGSVDVCVRCVDVWVGGCVDVGFRWVDG